MAANRVNVLWAILGVVGGMALGAWYMGSRIQSPAEMAARTAAPEPSPILVPVELRVPSSDVVTRGTVRFGLPQPISIAPSTVKGGVGLISSLPRPSADFGEGEVILSASGRPVFVLQRRDTDFSRHGARNQRRRRPPARRSSGPSWLRSGHSRWHLRPEDIGAVERWYRKAGWDPFAPTREQCAAVLALERDWSDAARARLAAEAARETAVRAVAAARASRSRTRARPLSTARRVSAISRRLADTRAGNPSRLKPNARGPRIPRPRPVPMLPRRSPIVP